jgi:hypothetical protein
MLDVCAILILAKVEQRTKGIDVAGIATFDGSITGLDMGYIKGGGEAK